MTQAYLCETATATTASATTVPTRDFMARTLEPARLARVVYRHVAWYSRALSVLTSREL